LPGRDYLFGRMRLSPSRISIDGEHFREALARDVDQQIARRRPIVPLRRPVVIGCERALDLIELCHLGPQPLLPVGCQNLGSACRSD
jgi:hypothetical protein